jgi:hypothetical protein
MAKWRLDRELALSWLDRPEGEGDQLAAVTEYLERTQLAARLRALAGISAQREYEVCEAAAAHLRPRTGPADGRA